MIHFLSSELKELPALGNAGKSRISVVPEPSPLIGFHPGPWHREHGGSQQLLRRLGGALGPRPMHQHGSQQYGLAPAVVAEAVIVVAQWLVRENLVEALVHAPVSSSSTNSVLSSISKCCFP